MGGVWLQFRRLLLGTVIEALVEQGVSIDLPSIRMTFDDTSAFRVPRIDNFMRFDGEFSACFLGDPPAVEALRGRLSRVWPDLLAVVDLPIGDRLSLDENQVSVTVEGRRVIVRFHLVAD